jgi:hypothetical protein
MDVSGGECTVAVAPQEVVRWWQWYNAERPWGLALKPERRDGGMMHEAPRHEPLVAHRWVELVH